MDVACHFGYVPLITAARGFTPFLIPILASELSEFSENRGYQASELSDSFTGDLKLDGG